MLSYPKTVSNLNEKIDYDQYWQIKRKGNLTKLSAFQSARANAVLPWIEPNSSVLDIAAGNCAILNFLRDNKNIKATALDKSQVALEAAKSLGFEAQQIDISCIEQHQHLPKVDYILALEILEHIPNAEEVLLSLTNFANKAIILSVPNTGFISHRLRLLFGRFPLQWLCHPGEHLRFWTVTDLRWWLTKLNLDSCDFKFYEGTPILNRLLPRLFAKGQIVKISIL
jgi:methionine biosynthesis protein MetW